MIWCSPSTAICALGGQRQRIALARTVFDDPKLIVLDEPNASLDHTGEEALVNALGTLKARGVTLVVIAHRPRILHEVDKILVLGKGTVQMFGPRDEVIASLGSAADEEALQRVGKGSETATAGAPRERAPEGVTDIRDVSHGAVGHEKRRS